MADDRTLAARLVDEAERAIGSATETHYDHVITIDAAAGIYDCDCSGFVGFLIEKVASRHYAMIAASTTDTRPLAHVFYRFAAAQAPEPSGGWRRIERLDDARPGDIVAWQLPVKRQGDTGHVFVVAAAAVPSAEDDSLSVRVHDSTAILHFDDTRGEGHPFATGIGSGSIHFHVDGNGAPVSFRFDPRTGYERVPIAIMRIEPFSAG